MSRSRHPQAMTDDEAPSRHALELASMCDLVDTGVARTVSATFPRADDAADITTLAHMFTAGRGLEADVELGPRTITVHIRRPAGESSRG